MLVTTCLTSLVMILCWHKPPLLALAFLLFFGSVEALYFSASLIKFLEGAWLPILLALFLVTVMYVWHYATIKKYEFDLHNKVSIDWLLALGTSLGIARVPGIGLVYTNLITGIPANFTRFVTNLPAFHRVLVFVCVKSVPVPFIPPAERYLIGRVGPRDHRSYRCIVRYGYRDVHQDVDSFESELVDSLTEFIRLDATFRSCSSDRNVLEGSNNVNRLTVVGSSSSLASQNSRISNEIEENNHELVVDESTETPPPVVKRVRFAVEESTEQVMNPEELNEVREELEDLWSAQEAGTAFIMGHSHVKANPNSSFVRKIAIDFGYNFLRRNCRSPEVVLRIPPASLLEVGVVYIV